MTKTKTGSLNRKGLPATTKKQSVFTLIPGASENNEQNLAEVFKFLTGRYPTAEEIAGDPEEDAKIEAQFKANHKANCLRLAIPYDGPD